MNIVFFGSDIYGANVLSTLLTSKFKGQISVVTDQVKPKQKGHITNSTPVEKVAKEHNLKVSYYPSIHDILNINTVGIVSSFDHLLPASVVGRFEGQLYNLHPSRLPQYRNVAPVPYALAMGDHTTGITLFRIDNTVDNGQIVAQVEEPILPTDTAPVLLHRLFVRGANLFIDYLDGKTKYIPQVPQFPRIFTHRLTSIHGFVEWSVLTKLLNNSYVKPQETTNPLLQLRLTHNPSGSILHDLIRGLTSWEKVWTLAPTKKGTLRLTLEAAYPELMVKPASRPRAVTYVDFAKYYL